MKSKFISVLLVSLLSISITACSNNKRNVNPVSSKTNSNKTNSTSGTSSNNSTSSNNGTSNNNGTSSNNGTSNNNSKSSNNRTSSNNGTSKNNNFNTSTSINLIPTPANTSSKQILDANDKNSIMGVYKAVLKNETEFFNVGNEAEYYNVDNDTEYYNVDSGKNVLLEKFSTDLVTYGEGSGRFKKMQFAVIDLDGDGVPEVVVKLTKNNLYEVLHYFNGKIYGYTFDVFQLGSIKIDGTFSYFGVGGHNVFRKLRFQEGACITDSIGYVKITNINYQEDDEEYFIDNKQVTQDEYDPFENKQNAKKEITWYDFTDDNIESKISINQ
ncbi:MAG: hypothetical protein Q8900_09330 [Bacillota bacterium]|nr:hypothetical protein [Bacillota bacterium]